MDGKSATRKLCTTVTFFHQDMRLGISLDAIEKGVENVLTKLGRNCLTCSLQGRYQKLVENLAHQPATSSLQKRPKIHQQVVASIEENIRF